MANNQITLGNDTVETLEGVTRFEVIENGQGRTMVRYGVIVQASLQDDGRTLKIFLVEANKKVDKPAE